MVSKEQQRLEKEKKWALKRGKLEEAATICNELGGLKSSDLNFEDALEEHKEELELSEKLCNTKNIAIAHRRIGETLVELAQYKDAINHHNQYLKLAEKCGDSVEVQRAWATIGRTFFNYYLALNEDEIEETNIKSKDKVLKKAEDAYYKALGCAENIKGLLTDKGYAEMKARLLLNLALVFDERKIMSECSKCLRRAISLCKNNNFTEDLHRCQYSLASIYFSYGKMSASKSATDQALNSAKSLKNKAYLTDTLLLKCKLQLCFKDYCSGKHYAKKAYKRTLPAKKEVTGDFLKSVIHLSHIAEKLENSISADERLELYEKLADAFVVVQCFTAAIENYKAALALAIELEKSQKKIAPIYFSLAQTSADAKDFSNAVEYWKKEIECNADNSKEICMTLLEVSKVQEKQGLEAEVILSSYEKALELAEISSSLSLQHVILEKKLAFEHRQALLTAEETSEKLKSIGIVSSDEENDLVEDSNSNSVDKICENINLKDLSDFTDSEEESKEMPERSSRKRSGFQLRKNEKGETPLHRACMSGNLKLVKKLLQQGHPINPRDYSGWLPIHEAANYGFLEIVEYLVENGAWINDPGGVYCGGVTPLHDAAVGGHLQLIHFLLSKGACARTKTTSGETPLDCFRQWKMEVESDLDSCTINDCIRLEELMAMEGIADTDSKKTDTTTNRAKRKSFFPEKNVSTGWITEDDVKGTLDREPYPNCSPENEVEMDVAKDIEEYDNPLLSKDEMLNDWEDPKLVCNEYQTVMDNIRKMPAPGGGHYDEYIPEIDNDPFHIADDWIIDDLTVNKSATKKRKRTLEDFNYSRTTIKNNKQKVHRSNASSTHYGHRDDKPINQPIIVEELTVNHTPIETPHCLGVTVHICGESIAVPVTDPALTFGWLAERTAQSYMETHGTKPKLTLLRQDGAVLSKQDTIASFSDRVINAQVDSWEESSLLERFTKSCEHLKLPFMKAIESKVTFVENSGLLDVSAGSVFSRAHLKPLLNAVRFQDNLKSLSLNEFQLSYDMVDILCKSLPTLSSLIQLNLHCCGLDTPKLIMITDTLSKSQKLQIQDVDLSYNFFNNESVNVIRTLLSCLSLLRSINFSFCDLPAGVFRSPDLVSTIRTLVFLRVLNVSGNCLSMRGVKDYLQCISFSSLVCLDLSHTVAEPNLGKLLTEYLPLIGSSLRSLKLRDCALNNSDMELLAGVLENCLQIEEIDVSANPDLNWSGLCRVIRSVKVHDLPLLSFAFLGCNTNSDERLEDSFKVVRIGHIKKVFLSDSGLSSNYFLKLQEEWLSCFGSSASVSRDAFGAITLSRDLCT